MPSVRATVNVFDHFGVGRGQLIELVDAITDRRGLALYILLAGKGVDLSPEAFVGVLHQCGLAAGAGGGGGGSDLPRSKSRPAGSANSYPVRGLEGPAQCSKVALRINGSS